MRALPCRPALRAALMLLVGVLTAAAQDERRKEITITATAHGYEPARIEVTQNEVLAVTFVSTDGPHSLNIDDYRIAKRASPDSPARFELRVERAGRFPYYCNLTAADGRAHEMRGELVVRK